MTTKDFLVIEKRLLPSFPGFVSKGRLMFIQPVEHTLRGFHFDPSAFSKRDFYVNLFFLPLYVPASHVHLTFGHRLRNRSGERWSGDQPEFEAALRSEMLREVVFLAGLKTADDVVKALQPFAKPNQAGYTNPHSYEALAYSLIRAGQAGRAATVIDNLLSSNPKVDWEREIIARAGLIREKLSGSFEEAERQLTIWENETTHSLGLDAFVSSKSEKSRGG